MENMEKEDLWQAHNVFYVSINRTKSNYDHTSYDLNNPPSSTTFIYSFNRY